MTPDALPQPILDRLAAAAEAEGLIDAAYDHVDTPIGTLLVVQTPRGVARIGFPEEREDLILLGVAKGLGPRVLRSPEVTAAAREAIAEYLEGGSQRINLPADLALARSDFHRSVLHALQRIPRGDARTYGAVAAEIGKPGAVRATGTACGRNPVPILVPCHRVVPAGGGVGNYGGGPARKERLLELEGWLTPKLV
jgi:methylated-DNA-[protein]-cysteine S-methyltransferase